MGMIDITGKKVLLREAVASGRVILLPETIKKIRENQVKKGEPS